MPGFHNGNLACFPTQDEDSEQRKEDRSIRKDGIGTPPLPNGKALPRDKDTRQHMTRPEVLGHNPAKRVTLALEGKT